MDVTILIFLIFILITTVSTRSEDIKKLIGGKRLTTNTMNLVEEIEHLLCRQKINSIRVRKVLRGKVRRRIHKMKNDLKILLEQNFTTTSVLYKAIDQTVESFKDIRNIKLDNYLTKDEELERFYSYKRLFERAHWLKLVMENESLKDHLSDFDESFEAPPLTPSTIYNK
uniref:Prolyl 4-hydroxylase alpha-subunit N-terminal domain-containing protein n=1 Tax=Clastoptera arizonana TaxID=38151 RepID=A0A1B6CZL6_9HEMI